MLSVLAFVLHCAVWLVGLAGVIAFGMRLERWEDEHRPNPDPNKFIRAVAKYTLRVLAIALFLGLLAVAPISCTKSGGDCQLNSDRQSTFSDCE